VAESQTAGDAVGDAVGGAEGVAHGVGEAEAALHVLAEEGQGGEGGEEELGDGLGVVGVGGVRCGEVGEKSGDGLEGELFAGDLGGGGVVEELDGVVEAADRRREPEVLGRVGAEGGVVEDGGRVDAWMADAGFDAVGLGVAGDGGALGGGQGGGDGDVVQEVARLFVLPEGDGFGAVDGGAAADGDEGVDG
jgi:hypothetical protein